MAADTNTNHHEADLVYQAEGEHPAEVILDYREEDREHGHGGADIDQHLGAGIASRQPIDRNFGGKGAQENHTGGRCLWVGVGEPAMHQGKSAFDAKGGEDEDAGKRAQAHRAEGRRTGLGYMQKRTGEQQQAG